MEKLIDDGPIIDVASRSILKISDMREVVVTGDNNSQLITFSLYDKFDQADVLNKNIWIKYINADGFGDKVAAVDKRKEKATLQMIDDETGEVTGEEAVDVIRFGWIVDQYTTNSPGDVAFAIEITAVDYKWSTMAAVLHVEETVHVEDSLIVPEQTWMTQFEQLLEQILADGRADTAASKAVIEQLKTETETAAGDAAQSAETAKTYKDAAAASETKAKDYADAAKASAQTAANQASAAQNAKTGADASADRAEQAADEAVGAADKIPLDPITTAEIDAITV